MESSLGVLVSQLFKQFPVTETYFSLLYSENPSIAPIPEPVQAIWQLPNLFQNTLKHI